MNPSSVLQTKNHDKALKIEQGNNFRFNEELEVKKKRPVSNYMRVEAKFLKSKADLDRLSSFSHKGSTVNIPDKL